MLPPPVYHFLKPGMPHVQAINALGKKARDGTISVDDMAGGTFTISNGGVYGSLLSTPIINPPQSAILGMHSIQQRAMVINGQVGATALAYQGIMRHHHQHCPGLPGLSVQQLRCPP